MGRGTRVQNLASDLEAGQLVSILTCPLRIPHRVQFSASKQPTESAATRGIRSKAWEKCNRNYRDKSRTLGIRSGYTGKRCHFLRFEALAAASVPRTRGKGNNGTTGRKRLGLPGLTCTGEPRGLFGCISYGVSSRCCSSATRADFPIELASLCVAAAHVSGKRPDLTSFSLATRAWKRANNASGKAHCVARLCEKISVRTPTRHWKFYPDMSSPHALQTRARIFTETHVNPRNSLRTVKDSRVFLLRNVNQGGIFRDAYRGSPVIARRTRDANLLGERKRVEHSERAWRGEACHQLESLILSVSGNVIRCTNTTRALGR